MQGRSEAQQASADDNGWIEHDGGDQPANTEGERVQVVFRGNAGPCPAVHSDMVIWPAVLKYRLMYEAPANAASETSVLGYEKLADVLQRAYDQASRGKGKERHAVDDTPFHEQPMQQICQLTGGSGFANGQAIKKIQESRNLPHEASIKERLGAIVYIAGSIIHDETQHATKAGV